MPLFKCCGSNDKEAYEVHKYKDGKFQTETIKDMKKMRQQTENQAVVKVEKSEYDDLLKKYKGDKKFSDETFPPTAKSLGKIENVPEDCEWKRISEITSIPKLFVDGIEPRDVIQGSLGDCYFLSALAALAEDDKRIRNVFGNQQYNPNGLYKVTLRIDGVVKQIVIDDYIPINRAKRPLFCQPNKNEYWVVLLEKAWAKQHGSYENIASGTPTEVLKAVSYAPTELKPIRDNEQYRQNLWKEIHHQAQVNNPCCAGTRREENSQDIDWKAIGLIPSHAYTLLNAEQFKDEEENFHKILKLRNPWGNTQWAGEASEADNGFWARIIEGQEGQSKEAFLGRRQPDDGIFFMKYEDFCHYFNQVHICNMLESPKYETEKHFSDGKHGTIYKFKVNKPDTYFIELHQSGIRAQTPERVEQGLNRSTLFLVNASNYEFINGSLKYQEEDNTLKANLQSGEYLIYAKIDPTFNKKMLPEKMSISSYSNSFVDLIPLDKKKEPDFFKKVFLNYARKQKRKPSDDGKMWITWKLLYEKGGFAFVAFIVEKQSTKKYVVNFKKQDFENANYQLKKPFKDKDQYSFEVKPGEQQIIVARVKNGPLQAMKFPPPMDIKIDRA